MMKIGKLIAGSAAAVALFAATSASALTAYTDVVGTFVSFTGIQEASSSGDPEPLFDQPISGGPGGNQLLFFPPAFFASSSGGGFDHTGSQLQLTIEGNTPTETISEVSISEFGDVQLVGGGTSATGAFAAMVGFITVTESLGVAITPVVIPFVGVFTPGDTFDLIADPGVTVWSATTTIDIASAVPDATKMTLSLDNDLYAYSEAGTLAKIQKKVVDGPAVVIEVVPEPTTGLLFAGGLLGLAFRARGRRG